MKHKMSCSNKYDKYFILNKVVINLFFFYILLKQIQNIKSKFIICFRNVTVIEGTY